MESTIILDKYWKIFLSHFCEYLPLTKEFIQQWEYELDWHSLSKNTQIEWSMDFLEQYQENLVWYELAWNKSIIWDIIAIEKFKKRLQWYYLGQNPNLPLSEAFLEKYKKKIVYIVDSNPSLSPDFKEKYNLSVFPDRRNSRKPEEIPQEEDLEIYLQNLSKSNNVFDLYQKVFLPILETIGLENIFENKFDYSQRYFHLESKQHDIFGLTPEFEFIDAKRIFLDKLNSQGLFELTEELVLKNGSLQEGKDRLLEFPRLSTGQHIIYTQPVLLISENVKNILEQFKLPEHAFYPVKLNHRKIKSDVQYFLFHVVKDTLFKDLDYEKCEFFYTTYDEPYTKNTFNEKINSFEDLKALELSYREKYNKFIKIRPKVYYLQAEIDYDVFSIDSNIIVNDFLRQTLERNFVSQMDFTSLQLRPIKMNQQKYDSKRDIQQPINIDSKPIYTLTELELFYQSKMQRLELSQEKISVEMTQDDLFRTKEIELNVIFSSDFKSKIQDKKIKIRGFKMLKPANFYIENEYADRNPETYKSVVIATDGSGDTINLLLQKDSDYLLGNTLYRFCHESGQVKKI